jgi:peptidoglycan/LPS O-acetylase OafA/YrhL
VSDPHFEREAQLAASGGRFIAGDPLRALAAASVVIYHVAFTALLAAHVSPTPAAYVLYYGSAVGSALQSLDLGLYVFFVLSGYLIARPFVRALVVGDADPVLGRYLRNRALRIVPAFWAIFTILLIRHGTYGASPSQLAAVYLFGQNYHDSTVALLVGPAWTLDVEVVFYLFLPVCALLAVTVVGRRGRQSYKLALIVAAISVLFVASLAAKQFLPAEIAWKRSFPAMLFAFLPGIALAAIEIPLAEKARGSRFGRRGAVLLLLVGLLLLVAYNRLVSQKFGFDPSIGAFPGALASIGAGLLVAAPLLRQWTDGSCWRALDNRAMRWLGRRSYSVYLIHTGLYVEFLSIARSIGPGIAGFVVSLLAMLPALLVASAVSFRLFELPFLRRRTGWHTQPTIDQRAVERPVEWAGS